MKVCIGGTFDFIHKGHKFLIDTAFRKAGINGFVFIGLADNDLIKNKENIKSYDLREKQLKDFIKSRNYESDYKIEPIFDIFGPTTSVDFDVIVVSKETRGNADIINDRRVENGLKPLKIVEIPIILSNDGKPISSTRIRNGEINIDGHII